MSEDEKDSLEKLARELSSLSPEDQVRVIVYRDISREYGGKRPFFTKEGPSSFRKRYGS